MAIVTIHQTNTHFSQLIQRALAGEEIIVAKGKDPLVEIVPLPETQKAHTLGGAKGIVQRISPDFDTSLEEFPDALK